MKWTTAVSIQMYHKFSPNSEKTEKKKGSIAFPMNCCGTTIWNWTLDTEYLPLQKKWAQQDDYVSDNKHHPAAQKRVRSLNVVQFWVEWSENRLNPEPGVRTQKLEKTAGCLNDSLRSLSLEKKLLYLMTLYIQKQQKKESHSPCWHFNDCSSNAHPDTIYTIQKKMP